MFCGEDGGPNYSAGGETLVARNAKEAAEVAARLTLIPERAVATTEGPETAREGAQRAAQRGDERGAQS